MKLSKKWLNEYVDLPGEVSLRQFADTMAMAGFCVGGVDEPGEGIEKVVVGKLLKIEGHPTKPKYYVCQVDVGDRILQQVTAAPNLKEGALCPVCLPGGKVKGGHEGGMVIGSAEFDGVKSEGMMCSLPELGLTVSDFPYGIENGIFFIEEPCEVGQDIKGALGLDDMIYDMEITANRPDAQSVIGISREVAAAFDKPFRGHTPAVKAGAGQIEALVDVKVEAPVLCPRYTARAITNVKIGPSPKWLRERVKAGGMRPINNIVDITNYIMMEYGQPMHAFDIREIAPAGGRGHIVVRQAGEGVNFTALDRQERAIPPETLMICNAHEPIGIAGIMGGLQSGIKPDTRTVVFESANFHYAGLRRSGRKLGLHTDALARYEKGISAQMTAEAVDRACELCELLGCADVLDGTIDVDSTGYTERVIKLEPEKINKLCGTDISREEMVKYLSRLGFSVEGDDVHVPAHRADCEGMADLSEEIVRLYGLNNVPSRLHEGAAQGKYSQSQLFERAVMRTLAGFGFFEAVTYTFISPKYYDKIRRPENCPLRNSVVILNPLGEDTSILRTTTLPSMCEVLAKNYNNRNMKARLFEMGKVFLPNADSEKLPDERIVVTVGMYGECGFYDAKGAAESLCKALRVAAPTFEALRDDPSYHSGRCAKIYVGGKPAGIVGELHPAVLENYGIGEAACVVTLDLATLYENRLPDPLYTPLPKYPAVTRDIALVCDDALEVARIEEVLKEVCGGLLEQCKLFDVFRGGNLGKDKKSVAFSLVLRDRAATLTDETVGRLLGEALDILERKYGCTLRA
ncbi:MAG TPA: phenylalanine--tRNA ligase subunit beta [Candidatus Acidoferrum sp.]|nr:phenylalanine--tRNA ligase subunit beta [Candidatus Acidoferrum sp.]